LIDGSGDDAIADAEADAKATADAKPPPPTTTPLQNGGADEVGGSTLLTLEKAREESTGDCSHGYDPLALVKDLVDCDVDTSQGKEAEPDAVDGEGAPDDPEKWKRAILHREGWPRGQRWVWK